MTGTDPHGVSAQPAGHRAPGAAAFPTRGATLRGLTKKWGLMLMGLSNAVGTAAAPLDEATLASLRAEVHAAETAFARSMAERRFEAFGEFIADDAVFLNGGAPLRGKAAVLAGWKAYFDGALAPFSWAPDTVEVVGQGDLAQSIGPVRNPQGQVTARFYSTWRREGTGRWRVVLDNGYALCRCDSGGAQAEPAGCR